MKNLEQGTWIYRLGDAEQQIKVLVLYVPKRNESRSQEYSTTLTYGIKVVFREIDKKKFRAIT